MGRASMTGARLTEIDVTAAIEGDPKLRRLTNIIANSSAQAVPRKAITQVLNRTAGRARKVALESYDDWLDGPTDFTTSEKATLFRRAKAFKVPTTPAAAARLNASTLPDIETAVFIRPTQSSYLDKLIEPTKIGELYNRKPIIVPHERNLKTFEKLRARHIAGARAARAQRVRNVRRSGGQARDVARVKMLPNARLVAETGNVYRLRQSKVIARLLDHPDVFEIELGTISHLSPGIYFRFYPQPGNPELQIVRKLFHYEPDVVLPGNLPFTESGVAVMRDNFAEFYRAELIRCFREFDIPIPRYLLRSGESAR
jgi:hypothetical protein